MNLYHFLENYLKQQTLSKFPNFNTDELHYYYKDPYMYHNFFNLKIERGKEKINDIMKVLAYTLVYGKGTNINFKDFYSDLSFILNDFDPHYISFLNVESLFSSFKTIIKPKFEEKYYFLSFIDSIWHNYAKSLISCAKYLLNNFTDFNTYINNINNNPKQALDELNKITGFGEYLSIRFLNTIGCFDYYLLDYRLYPFFKSIDESVKDIDSFQKALNRQAEIAGVKVYTFNKLFQLIHGGDYLFHNLRIKSTRGKGNLFNNLTIAVKNAIDNKIIDL